MLRIQMNYSQKLSIKEIDKQIQARIEKLQELEGKYPKDVKYGKSSISDWITRLQKYSPESKTNIGYKNNSKKVGYIEKNRINPLKNCDTWVFAAKLEKEFFPTSKEIITIVEDKKAKNDTTVIEEKAPEQITEAIRNSEDLSIFLRKRESSQYV